MMNFKTTKKCEVKQSDIWWGASALYASTFWLWRENNNRMGKNVMFVKLMV